MPRPNILLGNPATQSETKCQSDRRSRELGGQNNIGQLINGMPMLVPTVWCGNGKSALPNPLKLGGQ